MFDDIRIVFNVTVSQTKIKLLQPNNVFIYFQWNFYSKIVNGTRTFVYYIEWPVTDICAVFRPGEQYQCKRGTANVNNNKLSVHQSDLSFIRFVCLRHEKDSECKCKMVFLRYMRERVRPTATTRSNIIMSLIYYRLLNLCNHRTWPDYWNTQTHLYLTSATVDYTYNRIIIIIRFITIVVYNNY